MKKILITAGPVHAHLDAVKIITNKFKGGLISQLADDLHYNYYCYDAELHYVSASALGAKQPSYKTNAAFYEHKGFQDYERLVELAHKMDAIILGAAVANLIPAKPYAGKFPSHNYKEGEIIPIDFMIAPRVINKVKKVAIPLLTKVSSVFYLPQKSSLLGQAAVLFFIHFFHQLFEIWGNTLRILCLKRLIDRKAIVVLIRITRPKTDLGVFAGIIKITEL